jgi:hypothetical protein
MKTWKNGQAGDRAGADFWYHRPYEPHYYPDGTGKGIRVPASDMTPEQIAEYDEGWEQAVEFGERKEWG